MAIQESWLETPTMLGIYINICHVLRGKETETHFCNHVHNCPAPIKLDPKHSPATALVANTATHGTWWRFNLPNTSGACPSTASVYSSLAPANRAWFPADSTLVMTTALMTLPAARAPVIWKTMVKGDVRVSLESRSG